MSVPRVLYIGMGRIAKIHARELAKHSIEVVCGVDPVGTGLVFRQRPVARFLDLDSAFEHCASTVDIVVIASPTRLHAQQLVEVSSAMPSAAIWVEKPLAISLEELEIVSRVALEHRANVAGIFHAASAPEVVWARERFARLCERHGAVTNIQQYFADAYAGFDADYRRETLLTPWVDSGINALSIVGALDLPTHLGAQTCHNPLTASASFISDDVGGTLTCSWEVAHPSKWTLFTFEDGALLRLDHQASALTLVVRGEVLTALGWPVQRLAGHYEQAFTELLAGSHPGSRLCAGIQWHHHLLGAQSRQ